MKLSTVAAAVAALLATDAKPTEAQIMAACIAADKKGGKDEAGLGPDKIEKTDKAEDEKDDKDEKAKDRKGKDEKDDPEHTNDGDPDDVDAMDDIQPKESANGNSGNGGKETTQDKKSMDKKGMDAAIKAAIVANDALHVARREVEPVLGPVTYDSAGAVYKAALVKLGVATDGVHESAYPALFKLARDKVEAQTPVIATDAARVTSMAAAIPGYGRLR
jgi:hypothetical protein